MAGPARLGIVGFVAQNDIQTMSCGPLRAGSERFLMPQSEDTTTIGRSVRIRGELSGTNDLVVGGDVEGVIRLPGASLTIQAAGHVRGLIQAQDMTVLGRVEGEIRVAGHIDVRSGAIILGPIFAARVSIEEGAVLRGHFDPSRSTDGLPESNAPLSEQLEALTRSLQTWLSADAGALGGRTLSLGADLRGSQPAHASEPTRH